MRELHDPQGDEGPDGWNMTSSDCVLREGSGRPTSAAWPLRQRKTGGKVKCDVGHPPEECLATVAEQLKGVHQTPASVSGSRAAAAAMTVGAAAAKGDNSCGSEGGNVVDGTDAVTS